MNSACYTFTIWFRISPNHELVLRNQPLTVKKKIDGPRKYIKINLKKNNNLKLLNDHIN